MSDNHLQPTQWYSAQEVATLLDKPLKQIEGLYQRAIDGHRTGVAYYTGPETPLILGASIMKQLAGVAHAV